MIAGTDLEDEEIRKGSMVQAKAKGLCIATRCATVEDFVARFHPDCDDTSIFVTTKIPRDAGVESQFAILLADRTSVMRGCCVVLEAWTDAHNRYGRAGMRLGVHDLTPSSKRSFEALLAARRTTITKDAPRINLPPPPPMRRAITVRVPEIRSRPNDEPPVGVAGSTIAVPRTPPTGSRTRDLAVCGPQKHGSVPLAGSALDAIGRLGALRDAQCRGESIDAPVVAVIAEGSRETRTLGPDVALPANHLMELSDASIAGFGDLVTVTSAGFWAPQSLAPSTRPPTLEPAEPWCTPTREVDAARLLELVRQTKPPETEDEPVPSLVVTGWRLVAVIVAAAIALASAVTFVVAS